MYLCFQQYFSVMCTIKYVMNQSCYVLHAYILLLPALKSKLVFDIIYDLNDLRS